MFQVPSVVALLGLALCVLPSHKAIAQQFSVSDVVYEAARNKIGLMRYCRNNELLSPAIADQTVSTVEIGLRKLPSSDIFAREQGDRAEQAGEEGYWEAGRRRDIVSISQLFSTTPADLCKEWADETLRTQGPRRRRVVRRIAVTASTLPLPQTELTPVEPIQPNERPAREAAVVRAASSTPPPPLPEKAPLLPADGDTASLQRTSPTAGNVASAGVTPDAKPKASGQAAPAPVRVATDAEGTRARAPAFATASAVAAPRPGLPASLLEKWPFNKLGRPQRCLMAGCKWSPSQ